MASDESVPSQLSEKWSFHVSQLIESPFSQRLDESGGRLLEVGATVETGSLVATNEKAKLELTSAGGEVLRLGSKTVAVFPADRALRMKAGSALLHLPEGAKSVAFTSPFSQAKLEGNGILILEITGNGGFKAISLSGEPRIVLVDGTERLLKPGNLTFVLENPGKFGPILDIDLLTLVSTSNLVSGFEKALACNGDVIRSMLMQRSRIRQRTRAFVGDAKDNQNFQLLNIRKKMDVGKE